jgi:hypothetical protein
MKYILALLFVCFWWEFIIWIMEGKFLMDLFGFWSNDIQCLSYINWVVFYVGFFFGFLFTQGLILKNFSVFFIHKVSQP